VLDAQLACGQQVAGDVVAEDLQRPLHARRGGDGGPGRAP
jgi:hypothetical protein